jgi:hypothetical protein
VTKDTCYHFELRLLWWCTQNFSTNAAGVQFTVDGGIGNNPITNIMMPAGLDAALSMVRARQGVGGLFPEG